MPHHRLAWAAAVASGAAIAASACNEDTRLPGDRHPVTVVSSSTGVGGSGGSSATSTGSGETAWLELAGDASPQHGSRIVADSAGNAVLSGWFQGSLNLGSSALSAPTG